MPLRDLPAPSLAIQTASVSPSPERGFSARRSWITLGIALLAALAIFGITRGAQAPPRGQGIPASAESARVAAEMASRSHSNVAPVVVVAHRPDGQRLTPGQVDALSTVSREVTPQGMPPVGPPDAVVAHDGLAAYTLVPVRVGAEGTDNIATIHALRDAVTARAPSGLDLSVTGGPAFGADIADAFSGANLRLILVTVTIVALLLLLTYRSPILWLIPLAVVGLADQLAAKVATGVSALSGLPFDAGIVSVLVFGAGTNYALLLISRYRDELTATPQPRQALARAVTGTWKAILASNLTVVLALLALVLASAPGTRGLGLAAGSGLILAALAVLTVLPAVLALLGPKVFWPFIPHPEAPAARPSRWNAVGHFAVRRAGAVVGAAMGILLVLASGLLGTRVGLTETEQFRVASDSQRGLSVIEEHFPGGTVAPLTVLTDTAQAAQVTRTVSALPGVVTVTPGGAEKTRTSLTVIGEPAPGSPDARALVREVRAAVHGIPAAHAMVGGSPAVDLDAQTAARHDLTVLAPIILAITALVLALLLRALVGPLVLLLINVASSIATIGAGAWVGRHLFGFPALDVQVPLIAYLFLVALGVDYTIFLVHRADEEAHTHGWREGVARAVGHTGAVITSAGIVLAGVFAALGVLPLVALGQIGLIVGLGVVIDTFVVRALLVPGVIALLGERFIWPRRAVTSRR